MVGYDSSALNADIYESVRIPETWPILDAVVGTG